MKATSCLPASVSNATTLPSGSNSLTDCAFDFLLDAAGAEQFKRAHVEMRGARQGRDVAQAFDRQRRDAVLGQEHGGGQADKAAARDQYGDFFAHDVSSSEIYFFGVYTF